MATYKSQFTGAEIDERLAAVDDCARVDGSYENLGAGTAEQLASSVVINNKAPYNYRTSGGSVDIGNRKTEKIIGGTIAWNQLVNPEKFVSGSETGVTITPNGDGTLTVVVSSDITEQILVALTANTLTSYLNIPIGHKFVVFDAHTRIGNSVYRDGFVGTSIGWNSIREKTTSAKLLLQIALNSVSAGTYTIAPQIIDLTQLLGSAIADYLYSLEQGTAGAGVAKFRQLFPKPYYAYDAGSLQSVKVSKAVMTGFNHFDKSTAKNNTYILFTDGSEQANNNFACTDYIKVVSGQIYFSNADVNLQTYLGAWYDADKNFISSFVTNTSNHTYTAPFNAKYVRFNIRKANLSIDELVINLHWDGERDGEYEEYRTFEYPLDPLLELRGIPKLDSRNNLYYDGDEYESDGKVTRRFGVVDLGTLTWQYLNDVFYSTGTSSSAKPQQNPICAKYIGSADETDKTIYIGNGGIIYVRDSAYSTAETFAAAMNGVEAVYELAEPTEETAAPYINPMIVDDFGTEEFVDDRDVAVPVGHDTNYMANLRAKLEMAPNSPDGDGDYIVRQTDGQNSYVELSSTTTIQQIIARLEALEGNASE